MADDLLEDVFACQHSRRTPEEELEDTECNVRSSGAAHASTAVQQPAHERRQGNEPRKIEQGIAELDSEGRIRMED